MRKIALMIALVTIASTAWAKTETKTFTATDESRVQACAKAKEYAQLWVRQNVGQIVYTPTPWTPKKAEYSTCDCGKSSSKDKTDCSIDATISN